MSTIVTTTTRVKGIFFRNPFYHRQFDVYEYGAHPARQARAGEGIMGKVHRLLNSRKSLNKVISFVEDNDNAACWSMWSIRSPFYTQRDQRTLSYESLDIFITAKGWNYIDEPVSGHCEEERATIIKINGYSNRSVVLFDGSSKRGNGYYLTYRHTVEDLIKQLPNKDGSYVLSLDLQ
jgi:hypothetical protein